MVVAAYLIASPNIRINSKGRTEFLELKKYPPSNGKLTIPIIKERAELSFQMVQQKMKNLVIINSSLSTFETIQACVEVGKKYAVNVFVIQPLLARVTHALENLSNRRHNPSTNEIIFITIMTTGFSEAIILKRNPNKNHQLYIAEYECYEKNHGEKKFAAYFKKYNPFSTIFLFETPLKEAATKIERKFGPKNCIFKAFKKWDYSLLHGGLLWAMDDKDGFNSRYHIANFSNGFEVTIKNSIEKTEKQHLLLADRTSLPCKIYGFGGAPRKFKLFYCLQYFETHSKYIQRPKEAAEIVLSFSDSSKQVLGYIDARGVPFYNKNGKTRQYTVQKSFSKSIPTISYSSEFSQSLPPTNKFQMSNHPHVADEEKKPTPLPSQMNSKEVKAFAIMNMEIKVDAVQNEVKAPVANVPKSLSSSTPPPSSVKPFSQSSSSVNKATVSRLEAPVKFLFLGNFYAMHVSRNGITKVLADSSGNEWTPLYFSMVEKTPTFGREAQNQCETFHKHVIYDIFEVIGKPLNEIKINPKWGFELIVSDGSVYFQIETPSGTRLFSQEIILASFLKAMKLQAETNLNAEIHCVQISTKFELNASQKALFVKAARKINLKIVSFV